MVASLDAWSALRGGPVGFLRSRWPWRSLAYLLTSLVVGVPALVVLLFAVLVGAVTLVAVVGVVVLGAVPVLAGLLGVVERRRLALVQSRPPSGLTWRERWRAGRRLPVSWPELGYAFLLAVVLWPLDFVLLLVVVSFPVVMVLSPALAETGDLNVLGWHIDAGIEAWLAALLGLVVGAVAAHLATVAAVAQAALARMLLDPREAELVATVTELRRSRVDLVDAFETERRRIERDLHDGVQQRLVALTMTLGRAELDIPDGAGLDAVQDAHRQAEEALAELRSTIRGIHPRVLVDHGLAAAVHELADRSAVPVTVEILLDQRLPPPVEQAAYFLASEALTNVARHSGATRVGVHGWRHEDVFTLTVEDDGVGGATADGPGTGLAGLAVRLDALGGRLSVTSPEGGPTEVRMECPV